MRNDDQPDDMIEIQRPTGVWRIAQCRRKLAVRRELPGAHAFDRAAQALRHTAALCAEQRLTLALPASWLVNNRAPSPVFKLWLGPRLIGHWRALLGLLEGVDIHTWPSLDADARERLAHHARALTVEGHAAAALTKVLALLVPDLVPLMDDAALLFLLGATDGLPEAPSADRPTASTAFILPMLDAFAAATRAAEPALRALAEVAAPEGLSPAQVLDRLLWMESWGFRLFGSARASWWWIADDDGREAIVTLDRCPAPGARPEQRLALASVPDDATREALRSALEAVWDAA